jgi:hypothetical protein
VTELETLDTKAAADVANRITKMQEGAAVVISHWQWRLRAWKDRRRPSALLSQNGITSISTGILQVKGGPKSVSDKALKTIRRMRWKYETTFTAVDHRSAEAASVGGLT